MLAAMVTASAQDTTPNRLLLNRNGISTAYAIDRVDSLSFAIVEGEVKAALEFKDVKITPEVDSIWVAVTKSEACYSYSIDVLPTNTVKRYDDETLARYFAQTNSSRFYDNFTNAALTGFETRLQNNTSYTVFTVAYDMYGVACDASRAEFTTPRKPTIGNPSVTMAKNINDEWGPLTKVEYTAPIVNDAPAAVIAKTPARVKGTTKKAPTRVKPLMRPRAIILSE